MKNDSLMGDLCEAERLIEERTHCFPFFCLLLENCEIIAAMREMQKFLNLPSLRADNFYFSS